jgi:peptidoglycan/xylan/chitin deacetylase (PgdA/CDA1 family)
MIKLLRTMVASVALVITVSCGQNSSVSQNQGTTGPDIGSAIVQLPVAERRLAIVHSATSRDRFYDPFAYDQLFASMQGQATHAGFPFDLLNEEGLTDAASLLQYDAIVIPSLQYVKNANRSAIESALLQAQSAGVALVASGELMTYDENGQYISNSNSLTQLMGLEVSEYLNEVEAAVKVATNDHPITSPYAVGETVTEYNPFWFASFAPASAEQSTVLLEVEVDGASYPGAQVVERTSRVVHFANEQLMADSQVIWRALQWVVYGDAAPVTLRMSRDDSIFIARNDMDQAMIAAQLNETEIPLLDIIKEWKRDYNFVGSYYIDIGNNPAGGQYTDWAVSAPLYQEYIALGNEIGTHSWTHPHHTSNLTDEELEFEFNQSRQEIGDRLGVPVIGGAVPGNPESLNVVENLNQWFTYFSGRSGEVGSGYPRAIGFMEPQHDMLYFSLNMAPDFTLIDVYNLTPEQATDIWKSEIDGLLTHAQQPILHWLWHDYGPTTSTAAGTYSKEMFADTIAYATSKGTEFVTLANLQSRIRSLKGAIYSVGSGTTIDATVTADRVGQFALKVAEGSSIASVADWYAYDEDQVFLADDGGRYEIAVGNVAADVTRISKLPMRARLMSVSGDGDQLQFTVQGEGEVVITLSQSMMGNAAVSGADSFVESDGLLRLQFGANTEHQVSIEPINPINTAPVASPVGISAVSGEPVDIVLTATDAEGDSLSYELLSAPRAGTLTGAAPALTYQSEENFTGTDSFTFRVNDGALNSATSTVQITVTPALPVNRAPVANRQVLATLAEQPLTILLSGSDIENQPLSYSLTRLPQHGVITGTPPGLIYMPFASYTGDDEIEFLVSDGVNESETATVVINVVAQPIITGGTVSNEVSAIQLDGALTDWSGSQSFGLDGDEVNDDIDWSEAWMGHDASNFYLAYRAHSPISLSWGYAVYLDTDTSDASGFRGFAGEFPIGADYLLEGDSLYRFNAPSQSVWGWEYVGGVAAGVQGDSVELSLPRALLGDPTNISLLLKGNSAANGGTDIDLYPDEAQTENAVLKSRRFSYSVNANSSIGNVAPVANDQVLNTQNNAQLQLILTGSDLNTDPLTFRLESSPQHGSVTGTPPNLSYQPNAAYEGEDSFTFIVSDGALDSNAGTVTFNVQVAPALNTAPVANTQSVSTQVDVAAAIELTASDADGDALIYTVQSQPANGQLTGQAPSLQYAPESGFSGTDSFTFSVSDGVAESALATIEISVAPVVPVNTVPVANAQSVTTAFETAVGIVLDGSDADGDALTYTIVEPPSLGALQGTAPSVTYVPNATVSGDDSFTFIVSDGTESSAPATVNVAVLDAEPVNRAPIASGQTLDTGFGQALAVVLNANDPDGDALDYVIIEQPTGGVINGTAPDLTYTPNNDFSGLDGFRFTANDGALESEAATVTIRVGTQPSGVLSNPVNGITIDGTLSDWGGVQSYPADPDDVSGVNNPLDWIEAWVAHDADNFYIAFRNDGVFSLSWGQGIFIDTDGNANTGFRGFSGEFPIGAEYLIETDDLHVYSGDGQNWSWNDGGATTITASGDVGELAVPRSALGDASNLRIYFRANNVPFQGSAIDHYPDRALDATAPETERSLWYTVAP